jgi:hypothetical protein
MNPDPITKYFREGMEAFKDGMSLSDCPYPFRSLYEPDYNREDRKRREWNEGWYWAKDVSEEEKRKAVNP